jgi:hypothetical protein
MNRIEVITGELNEGMWVNFLLAIDSYATSYATGFGVWK